MEDKIVELEIMLAHQDQQLTEMSDVMAAQWKVIDALQARLDRALAKIEQLGEDKNSDSGEPLSGAEFARQNIPPHY